jgi:hypothetical protein
LSATNWLKRSPPFRPEDYRWHLTVTAPPLLELLRKWGEVAKEQRVSLIRVVKVAEVAAHRLQKDELKALSFDLLYNLIFYLLQEVPSEVPQLFIHWKEMEDGTKWLYFCKADPNPDCDNCSRRVDCLTEER